MKYDSHVLPSTDALISNTVGLNILMKCTGNKLLAYILLYSV